MAYSQLVEWLRHFRQRHREAAELAQLNEHELAEIRACQTAAEQAGSPRESAPIIRSQPAKCAVSTATANRYEG